MIAGLSLLVGIGCWLAAGASAVYGFWNECIISLVFCALNLWVFKRKLWETHNQ